MARHSIQERMNAETVWNHHIVMVDKDDQGWVVDAIRFDSDGTYRGKEIFDASPDNHHRFHTLEDCPVTDEFDWCEQVPFDVGSYSVS
jgi:hypothetical protein